mmetsp:Transcript_13864/g.20581  ORF Transcript_13864/g.20581 Transcript_13864/m.20581 type:complete len:101 (+) Transcript_13864:68-370(+)
MKSTIFSLLLAILFISSCEASKSPSITNQRVFHKLNAYSELRGGKASKKKLKKGKISPWKYVSAYFGSLIDPSYNDRFIEKPVHSMTGTSSLKKKKASKK